MAIEHIFDSASSVMTVISFTTFVGILVWTYAFKGKGDFARQAALPFDDEDNKDNKDNKDDEDTPAQAFGESGRG